MKQELAEYLFHEGTNFETYKWLGSFLEEERCTFRVWAPHAKTVYVTGEFCDWNPTQHPMNKISDQGIYELVLSNIHQYDAYKYVIETTDGRLLWKADPYARHAEVRPQTASKVYQDPPFIWNDQKWMHKRRVPHQEAMNIYEVHLGSWKQHEDGTPLTYRELAVELVQYVKKMGYTHLELLPITEYPYDKSWGYQVTGYFATTSRYGTPEDFKFFVDTCHQQQIGVILDWVPGHFTKDEFGLMEFDGSCCYEYSDVRKQEHKSWGTRVFDYGRGEVISFLLSSANFWLEEFHIDGLRVDAVSSMIFLNYDRSEEEAAKNIYGGNDNLEVLALFRQLNTYVHDRHKGVMMIAEESTAYPKVTAPIEDGGLGFDFKWNMGWMNDSLSYLEVDPYFRSGCHDKLTFSMFYAFAEHFILPISHDEVVHGKKSLLDKANVPYEEKFSNYRAFLGYMFAHPGKKLTFMGSEIPQFIEWNEERPLDWFLLKYPAHDGTHRFVEELNHYYKKTKAFWQVDESWQGFRWNVVDDKENNVFAFTRTDSAGNEVVVISNFSGQLLKNYPLGVHSWGHYRIQLNSDARKYGGSGLLNRNLKTTTHPMGEFEYTLEVNLAPFSTIYLEKM